MIWLEGAIIKPLKKESLQNGKTETIYTPYPVLQAKLKEDHIRKNGKFHC